VDIDGNAVTVDAAADNDITLTTSGTGRVVVPLADINGGTIDGTTIGGTTPAAGTFTAVTVTGLSTNSIVYTDGTSSLTTTPPGTGPIGYWNRTTTVLSPTNAGDDVRTSGNISTTGTGTITSAGLLTGTAGATVSGGAVNLNASSPNATNINTGTSTGTVTIGNSASETVIASSTTTVGGAGTTAGDGVRIGNGRVTINKPATPITGLTTDRTVTVSEVLDAGIIGFSTNGAVNLTLPGATALVQALPGTPAVGDVFTMHVFKNGNNDVTIIPGANITIVNTNGVTANNQRTVVFRVTSVTPGSEAISIY
jgi:hypothetical protein